MNLKKEINKFAPVELKKPTIPKDELETIDLLVTAGKIMNLLFLRQVYDKNDELIRTLKDDELELFLIHYGPFNRLDHNKPFIEGHKKPLGANFYPGDITKEEFLKHINNHPEDKKTFESEHTIIRRENNKLVAIPYSEYFKNELEIVYELLKKAASITKDDSLKNYLNARADDFLKDDYFDSDMLWMDLNGDLDITIGPYEVYEDELFAYKTAFEAVIAIRDHEESEKLNKIKAAIPELDEKLPYPEKFKGARGNKSPLVIADLYYSGGDARAGVHFTAFNLPNDERVRKAKGSKKVLMKNVANAKFNGCWIPISEIIIHPDTKVTFDGYFTHILLHEIAHGLGPGFINVNGEKTTVGKALKDLYSTIEEAKADMMGALSAFIFADIGLWSQEFAQEIGVASIAGAFRSVRFGINEAHGGANIIEFNFLKEFGAIEEINGKFRIVQDKVFEGVKALTNKLVELEGTGDYHATKEFVTKYRVINNDMKAALEKLNNVPVDVLLLQ